MAKKKREIDYKAAWIRMNNSNNKAVKELEDYKKALITAITYIMKVYKDKDISNVTLAQMVKKSIYYNLKK